MDFEPASGGQGSCSSVLSVDALFNRCIEDGIWTSVDTSEVGLELSRRELIGSADTFMLRVRRIVDSPFDDVAAVTRPEVFFHPRRPEYDAVFVACGIERTYAPCDADAWFRPRFPNYIQRTKTLLGATQDEGHDLHAAPLHRIRMVVRRDFPGVGQRASLTVPRHPDSGELLAEWGITKVAVKVVEPHEDAQKCVVTEFTKILGVGDWAVSMWSKGLQRRSWITTYIQSPVFKEAMEGKDGFMVLGIRKTSRGPPLLPLEASFLGSSSAGCSNGASEVGVGWSQPAREGFRLPKYLELFLTHVGVEDCRVFDSIDGRCLMPCQAAVRRGDWERAWATLEEPFREQRAAYKKMLGGPCAPTLFADVHARYLPLDAPRPASVLPECRGESHMPVQRTFVHFGSGVATTNSLVPAALEVSRTIQTGRRRSISSNPLGEVWEEAVYSC